MKFTILSHASMIIEHNDHKIIIDPWLLGSCYWRSWWNFPEPSPELIYDLKPDFIYLTHLHWDHFHGVSLKKLFPKDTKIIVPKVQTKRMVDDLNYLGFKDIFEIPHNKKKILWDDFSIQTYQFGPGVDSAIMLSGGGYNLFNTNDCKIFGGTLKNINNQYKKIDFVFRSHTSASSIPYCINNYKSEFTDYRTKKDYAEEFSIVAFVCNSRFAVPFASNHCFLHKETIKYNDTSVDPASIEPVFKHIKDTYYKDRATELKIMSPGSTWSDETGFKFEKFDYLKKDLYIRSMLEKHKHKLDKQYEIELKEIANFELFEKYFTNFLNAVPWFYRKLMGKSIIFFISDLEGEKFWEIDLKNSKISQLDFLNDKNVFIKVPSIVINDCTKNNMFSVWTASKRLEIYLPSKNNLKIISSLFKLLDLYELNRLPLIKNFSTRSIINMIRRWREILTAFYFFLNYKIFRKKLVIKNLYK